MPPKPIKALCNMSNAHLPPQGNDEAQTLSIPLLTQTIKSSMWWAYSTMLLFLHRFGDDFASWAEGCECHHWQRVNHGGVADAFQEVRSELGLPAHEGDGARAGPCPLAGLRAVELARGATKGVFEALENFLISEKQEQHHHPSKENPRSKHEALASQYLDELMPATIDVSEELAEKISKHGMKNSPCPPQKNMKRKSRNTCWSCCVTSIWASLTLSVTCNKSCNVGRRCHGSWRRSRSATRRRPAR